MADLNLSRREFISRTVVLAGSLAAGLPRIGARASSQNNPGPLRLVFARIFT